MKKTVIALLVSSALSLHSMANTPETNSTVFEFKDTRGLITPINVTNAFSESALFGLESGSFTFRTRHLGSDNVHSYFGVSNSRSNTSYLSFYLFRNQGQDNIGAEIRHNTNLIDNNHLKVTLPANSSDFRTITYTFDKPNNQINVYVDGEKRLTHNTAKFLSDIQGLNSAYLGMTKRLSLSNWRATGDLYFADFSTNVLTEDEVRAKHQAILADHQQALADDEIKRTALGAFKTEKSPLFVRGQENAKNYRIPSLLTTKNGVVIAAIDKRHQHSADWGNIDTAIRRSFDGGKTWAADQVVLDLIEQPYGSANSAFLIDPLMVQDQQSGRIFMLVDMFPETQGFFGINKNHSSEGTGYKQINGNSYRLLTDNAGNQYTVRENGVVFDEENQATEYRVVVEGSAARAYKDLGDLYRGEERLGNVFLQSTTPANAAGTSDAAPLKVQITSYLWLTYSDDDGQTWSNPVDLTPQVKADWMRFLGTGPGNGIQLKNGNLVMPIYYTNSNNKQSSAVIISKDGGKTWERGESPNDRVLSRSGGSRLLNDGNYEITEAQVVELDNGELKMFSRNLTGSVRISTSKDGGYTWKNSRELDPTLVDPYSQLSVIKYSKRINGKEYLVFANPHSSTRARINGKVWLGEVQEDGEILWKYNASIDKGSYAYNSLTELPNGDLGLLYEESAEKIQYVSLNLQEILWRDNLIYRDSRNPENKTVSYDSTKPETFYKIGDGEMVKVGTGANPAHLVVQEGLATLNQTEDAQGVKQAYASVTTQANGTVRLASADQLNLNQLHLEQGTFDLNGLSFNLTEADNQNTGLYASRLTGNLVNQLAENVASVNYQLNGSRQIIGNLGGENSGKIDLSYQPSDYRADLTLVGNSHLNQLSVQNGLLTLAGGEHFNHKTTLANQTQLFAIDTNLTAQSAVLGANANLVVHSSDNNHRTLNINSTGQGNFVKTGQGSLTLTGELAHTGNSDIQAGTLILDGQINQGEVKLAANAILAGDGEIRATTTLAQGSLIAPSQGSDLANFTPKSLALNHVKNLGTSLLFRVNNQAADLSQWQHDSLVINGNVESDSSIPVYLQLLQQQAGHSDRNNNGAYDVDEGIALIQVKGESSLDHFKLATPMTRSASQLYPYALVAIDKATKSEDQDYYEYRLQNLIIDENGNPIEPVLRYQSAKGDAISYSVPTYEGELTLKGESTSHALPSYEGELTHKGESTSHSLPSYTGELTAKGESVSHSLPTYEGNLTAKGEGATLALPTYEGELNSSTETEVASSSVSTLAAASVAPQVAESSVKTTSSNTRLAVNARVPAYLVAQSAQLSAGNAVRNQFLDNLWAENKRGFYVSQQHSQTRYQSQLGFSQYGYDYRTKQNSTLFGGYLPLGEQTELHLGAGISQQSVTPQAADGASEIKFKSVSVLAALHQHWGNGLVLDSHLAYHQHKGKVRAEGNSEAATIRGNHYQAGLDLGYAIPVGQFATITPTVGVRYQHLQSRIQDKAATDWQVTPHNQTAFSALAGGYLSLNAEKVRVKMGVFYEQQQEKGAELQLVASQNAHFDTAKLGNAVLFKLGAEANLTPNLKLGIQADHRHSVSKAKLKATNLGAKLTYQF